MAATRPGCYFCFKTLDPCDKREELRAFLRCRHCSMLYHAACWNTSYYCLKCGGFEPEFAEILSVLPLQVTNKMRALPTRPATVIRIGAGPRWKRSPNGALLRYSLLALTRSTYNMLLALLFIGISVFVSAFFYRTTQIRGVSARNVMNAIFMRALPSKEAFLSAFIGALISTLVFYPQRRIAGPERNNIPPLYVRIIAGGAGVYLLNYLLLDRLVPAQLLEARFDQIAAILIALLFMPLYRNQALPPLSSRARYVLPSNMMVIYEWIRFLCVSLFINLAVVSLAVRRWQLWYNGPVFTTLQLRSLKIPITLSSVGVF